ncbi:3',5'-cyclic-nucleotide phosphodiesterase pde1 [Cladophialophora chaetospira]|uniref:3',5'-cyclic-nucleotide phosphodiesterase pde1 n=1 Tax=Cladophialophora chaetospira TaxID=386627 RepID=A0AA39CQU9_9EURO|nr:3',5'-cyclic-nucleotide phosphodiesterase pde1 [Cladophialophora chaetospira]
MGTPDNPMNGNNDAALDNGPEPRQLGSKDEASFQVIVLGSTGGPREDNITGLLVRAPQTEWRKSSMIAVDAGTHLASMIRILQRHMPLRSEKLPPQGYGRVLEEGPFAGLKFPHISAKANGLHIFREILHGFLITHPHLDHLSGMAINTPALEYGREAKAIVALPSTIEAIKNHIFNDWLWPNLSDEGHGVGFVTYRRLIEGGNPRLGLGESRGYVNVCDGLATKCWSVSHGKCHRRSHSVSHQHGDSFGYMSDYNFPSRRLSRISDDHGYFAVMAQQQSQNAGAYVPPPAQVPISAGPVTPGIPGGPMPSSHLDSSHMFEPVSSSAFFIRNDVTGHELLIFGDVEPDSVSLSPRNHVVWDDAAGKVAEGRLKAVFIECSYDDNTRNEDLYGHLCPRHLIAELVFLANCVINRRKQKTSNGTTGPDGQASAKTTETSPKVPDMSMKQPPTPSEMKRKRKRVINGDLAVTPELGPTNFDAAPPSPISGYVGTRSVSSARRKHSHEPRDIIAALPATPGRGRNVSFQTGPVNSTVPASATHQRSSSVPASTMYPREKMSEPLKGLTVHLIHIKDTLMDGPPPGDIIVAQLRTLSAEVGLGCEFNVTNCGDSIWI